MPVNLPTGADVRKARAHAAKTINQNLEQVRPPLLALVGANDLALSAVRGALARARLRAKAVQGQLPRDLDDLRGRLSGEELRKVAEAYGNAARGTYQTLVQRGEVALDKIKAQPRVKRAMDTLDTAAGQAEERVEGAVEDFRERGNGVLARVTRASRSVGERVARTGQQRATEAAVTLSDASDAVAGVVSDTGDELAESVSDAGDQAADAARTAGRRVADRTAPATPVPDKAPGTDKAPGSDKASRPDKT